MDAHVRCLAVARAILVPSVVAIGNRSASAQTACPPLPPPSGATIEVNPDQANSLRAIVAGAATGTTVLLHDGTYDLGCGDSGCRLQFSTPGVALRSSSGNRGSVVLDGEYTTNELVREPGSGRSPSDGSRRFSGRCWNDARCRPV